MAERVFFFIENHMVKTGSVIFEWFPGFSVSQKQKSIASMHQTISRLGKNVLEVSTKSPTVLGQKLSAFHLKLSGHCLENIFQSGKVFSCGGPYTDLLEVSPRDAKRDERLRTSGRLVKFTYQGVDWPLEPKTVFYDYLYYCGVRDSIPPEELIQLNHYDAFTDIEFNANKSINTQARSIALVKIIVERNSELPEICPEDFINLHKSIC